MRSASPGNRTAPGRASRRGRAARRPCILFVCEGGATRPTGPAAGQATGGLRRWLGPSSVVAFVALIVLARTAAAQPPAPPPSGATAWFPPPPLPGVHRPFTLTLAAGPGALVGKGERAPAVAYAMRVGWGLDRNVSLFFAFEGVRAPGINPSTGDDAWLRQEILQVGIENHLGQRLYVRGAGGVGSIGEETRDSTFSGGRGLALSLAVGYDVAQLPRSALSLELAGSLTRYQRASWGTVGLAMSLALF